MILDHIGITVSDHARSKAFFLEALAPTTGARDRARWAHCRGRVSSAGAARCATARWIDHHTRA